MAIAERETKNIDAVKPNEEEQECVYNVFPDMRRKINHENRTISFEVSLPGVKKENISLKVLPNFFHLHAKRGQLMYSANQNFGKKITPEKTTAKYENGLLKITAYIPDPFEGAKEISL